MTQTSKEDKSVQTAEGATSWGPKLFFGTLVAILVFFYWLVIYAGGVVVHHG